MAKLNAYTCDHMWILFVLPTYYLLVTIATEAPQLGEPDRGVQEEETTPPGVWIRGPHGAKRTR